MFENKWILPASLIIAAMIISVGIGFYSLNIPPEEKAQVVVQIPNYLQKSSSTAIEASLSGFDGGAISFAEDESEKKIRLISVSGTVTKTASPELAYITLSIETLDKSASKSQADNATLANKVMDALKTKGINKENIETASYSLREEFKWNEVIRKSESVGYKTTNRVRVKVQDLGAVGEVIDAAVSAGANSVNSISFALTKETEASLRAEALKDASANARAKAQSIAEGLGISVGPVYGASESSGYSVPYYAKSFATMDNMESGSAPTPITPGDIEFTTSVSVQFEIQ